MGEWTKTNLADIALINPSENLKKGSVAPKVLMDALYPYTRKISYISYAKYNGGTKFKNNDTLIARITPCLENGKTAFVDILEDNQIGFGSTEFIVLRNKSKKSDPKFLYYLSISPHFREISIKSMTGSSGRQRVQTKVVNDHHFKIPPLPEQKAIAEVLSSLDDKIDLLHRQNKILESLAETFFRQWFVEEASEDWEEKPLDQIAKYLNGLACQKYPPKDDVNKLPVLKIKELKNGITENSDWATARSMSDLVTRSISS